MFSSHSFSEQRQIRSGAYIAQLRTAHFICESVRFPRRPAQKDGPNWEFLSSSRCHALYRKRSAIIKQNLCIFSPIILRFLFLHEKHVSGQLEGFGDAKRDRKWHTGSFNALFLAVIQRTLNKNLKRSFLVTQWNADRKETDVSFHVAQVSRAREPLRDVLSLQPTSFFVFQSTPYWKQ